MIKYGLISEVDARCLEKTMDLIIQDIKSKDERYAFVTEIGLFNCETSHGIFKYFKEHNIKAAYTGIDNEKDKPIVAPEFLRLIIGNSNEVYHQIEDNSQHLIFVDGCHCFAHVISDFFCYERKVKWGGYLVFHDTSKHIKVFKDFQHGDPNNIDAYISVRKALQTLGLVDNWRGTLEADGLYLEDWDLIFDVADPNDEAGGLCVFRRTK